MRISEIQKRIEKSPVSKKDLTLWAKDFKKIKYTLFYKKEKEVYKRLYAKT